MWGRTAWTLRWFTSPKRTRRTNGLFPIPNASAWLWFKSVRAASGAACGELFGSSVASFLRCPRLPLLWRWSRKYAYIMVCSRRPISSARFNGGRGPVRVPQTRSLQTRRRMARAQWQSDSGEGADDASHVSCGVLASWQRLLLLKLRNLWSHPRCLHCLPSAHLLLEC